jgi:glycerol-3-phosphate acyltransferase PlsY
MTKDPAHFYPLLWLFFAIGGFLLGSLPFGQWIGRMAGDIDVSKRGSGNIGATNVAREVGLKWGLLTLVLDVLKGCIPVLLATHLFPQYELGPPLTGLGALLGHQFSVLRRFRGGKGVATALGVFICLAPGPSLAACVLFVVTVQLTHYVSLGSILAACAMPLFVIIFGGTQTLLVTALVMAALVCLKHRDNIQRLVRGRERKWSLKGGSPQKVE